MRALIISYYWPPSGGSGVQRWMYFAKYLSEFGIEPTVITVDEKYASYSSTDESLKDKIRHVKVYKTKTLEPLRVYSFLKSGNAKKEIPQGNVGGNKKGLIDKIATYIRGNFFIPDARVGWNLYAYSKATDLLKNGKFDVVITTGPPHSTHLVGLRLKQKYNVKWIADFRDPWTEVYYNELFNRTKRNDAKDRNMELNVLENADLVLTVGPSMKSLLDSKIDNPEKVKYIYNGFDSTKLNAIERKSNQDFTICYIGTLSANYPYLAFIEALKKCISQDKNIIVTIKLVGRIEQDVISAFENIHSIKLEVLGNVSHEKALEQMVNANLLLLILPINEASKIIVSGKLLEYIASNVPILGILNPESDAAILINDYANGAVFHSEKMNEISQFIAQASHGIFPINEEKKDFQLFERRNTAKQLATIIKALD